MQGDPVAVKRAQHQDKVRNQVNHIVGGRHEALAEFDVAWQHWLHGLERTSFKLEQRGAVGRCSFREGGQRSEG